MTKETQLTTSDAPQHAKQARAQARAQAGAETEAGKASQTRIAAK